MAIFDEPSRSTLPQPTFEDTKYTALKTVLGLVGAGEGAELVGLISSPVAERRDDWFRDLQRRLTDLERDVEGFQFDNLPKNEQFISATLQATYAALRTHDSEKLEALRNAVVNVAIEVTTSGQQQQVFLALVDRFSADHLRILKFLENPAKILQQRGLSTPHLNHVQPRLTIADLVKQAFPSFDLEFVGLILEELVLCQLVRYERQIQGTLAVPASAITPGGGPVQTLITKLGEAFLAFISRK